jgi:hypothetical protein
MDINFNKLLGADVLSEEVQSGLQEAFNTKINEARQQVREEVEMQIREEFARRYEHDKGELVEAMDRMLTDVVQKYSEERVTEGTKLKEAKVKYEAALKESRAAYKTKTVEHMNLMRKFVLENLTKEVQNLRSEETKLAEDRVRVARDLSEAKKALAEQQAARLKKIDEFVVRQVNRELTEFAQDKRALAESRVKLISESRSKLREAQGKFIKESAKKVDLMVTESMKREMNQLHEDLERNRQNMFGRRIFEAVAAEFMSSYLAEGTATKKLEKVLESKDAEMAEMHSKLTEAQKAAEQAARKVKLAEDKTQRTKTLNELLSPLSRDKRSVMVELLETVKTQHLREAFNKYLPTVLNEQGRKVAPQHKRALNETSEPVEKRTVAVTGDQRTNRLLETVQAEDDLGDLTAQIVRLAGIQK